MGSPARAGRVRAWLRAPGRGCPGRSRIATVVVVPLTGNMRLAAMPGNVVLWRKAGLLKDSVANVSQVVAIDRSLLVERVGQITRSQLELIWKGIDILLDRQT